MWEFIDKIVYINLDSRQDRRDIMTKFFREKNVPMEKVIRFSAIQQKSGALGCLKSHTAVLSMAKQNNWNNVLILEDDLQWINFDSAYRQLEEYVRKPDWNVIMLTGWYREYSFPRIYSSYNTGAYLVKNSYYDTLLANRNYAVYMRSKALFFQPKVPHDADVSWDHCMKTGVWYGLYPCIISQVDGPSDNSKGIIKASLAVGIYSLEVRRQIWGHENGLLRIV